jgi:hypothetical protein
MSFLSAAPEGTQIKLGIYTNSGHFIKKLPGIKNAITPCEGLSNVEKIRDKLKEMDAGNIAIGFLGNPKEPSAMRGGPMFEFLFGLDTQLPQSGKIYPPLTNHLRYEQARYYQTIDCLSFPA